MAINRSKLLLSLMSAGVLILSCSPPANALAGINRLSANLLGVNLLAANLAGQNLVGLNSLSDKAKFDLQAVTVSKVTLPDGTVLTVR